MKYAAFKNGNVYVVDKPETEETELCKHKITISRDADGRKLSHCLHCNMIAHEDGNFSYLCGRQYCRCSD